MNDKQRKQLRKLRKKANISVKHAALWAHVEPRTWRSWETSNVKGSTRSPSPAALWSFFARAGLEMPKELKPLVAPAPLGRALSISSYKGGVGKSPLTVNVAACLVNLSYRVAIVTDDGVYRGMRVAGRSPQPGSLVSKIDFYDERELITFPAAVKRMKKEIRDNVTLALPHDRDDAKFLYGHIIETVEHKEKATEKLSELITRYDYVLIDVNVDIELIRRYADLVAIVLDSHCLMSIQSAGAFAAALRRIKCRETSPAYFGLITNNDVGAVSPELEEYVGDLPALDDSLRAEFEDARHTYTRRREAILKAIGELELPTLTTELTAAHRVAIEIYNKDKAFMEGYSYFHSLADVAPDSHAAREMRRLTDELINFRM